MRIYIWTIIVIVAAAVAAGFFIVGSPKSARQAQLDDQRVANLQYIQGNLVDFWMNKGHLPAALGELNDNLRGISVPKDPETSGDYAYTASGPLSFRLCATFSLPSAGSAVGHGKPAPLAPVRPDIYGGISQTWDHGAGYACFDRTIDKDFYKPLKNG